MDSHHRYDVFVIGAGPAAWSAAIFLARAGISVLVVGKKEDSGLFDAAEVLNYAGFAEGISGAELLDRFEAQAIKQGAVFVPGEVTFAAWDEGRECFTVKTAEQETYEASQLVLAHGANYIKASVPGERERVGRGVHYCALCDGPLYRGKEIAVLGNGNYAAEEALQLAVHAKRVTVISHSPQANFGDAYRSLLQEKGIGVVIGKAERIEGKGGVSGVQVRNGTMIGAQGVFVALGVASSAAFANQLGLEMNGDFVAVADQRLRTSRAGVWAVGMARGGVNQVARSVGDGAVAAVDIIRTVKRLPQYIDHT